MAEEYDNDLVEDIFERRKDASRHAHDWRAEARKCYEYRDGNQWDTNDMAVLEEQGRPIVTFNRCAPVLDSIAGQEIGNRQEARYFPRTQDDRKANNVFTEAARWVRDSCDAEDEESDAYMDTLTCGMGWIETKFDYDEDEDGKIIMERIPPLQMRWDPDARKKNILDANWLSREKWMAVSEVRAKWPDADVSATEDNLVEEGWMDEHDASNSWKYEQDQSWLHDPTKNRVIVIHYQWREKEDYYRVGDPETDEVIEFTVERYKKIEDSLDGAIAVKQQRWKYKQAFLAGKEVLEESDCQTNRFSYRCITAKRDEQANTWFGMMRAMMDPQNWANKFFSQTMHIFNANAKGGVLAEEDAVDDKRQFEDSWSSPDSVNWLNPGALQSGKIQEKSLGGYPSGLDKLLSFAISSIRDVTGVNLELMGMANREQAGVLEVERKKAALVILAPLLNNLRRYRKTQGMDLLVFMRKYIPEGTIMRITDQAVPFYQDDDTVKYDVIVDTAANSPNLKQEVWVQLQNIIPAMIKAGVPLPPDLIKFSPLPESISDEWVEYIEERSQQDPELPQKFQELQQQNQELSSKREESMAQMSAKREMHMLDMQLEREKMLLEKEKFEQDLAMTAKMKDADRATKLMEITSRYETERAKLQENSNLQRDISNAKLSAESEKQVISMADARAKRLADMSKETDALTSEVAGKVQGSVANAVENYSNRISGIEGAIEKLTELAENADSRRATILDFVSKQGGELAEVADKLR